MNTLNVIATLLSIVVSILLIRQFRQEDEQRKTSIPTNATTGPAPVPPEDRRILDRMIEQREEARDPTFGLDIVGAA